MRRKVIRMIISVLLGLTMMTTLSFAADLPFSDVPDSEWYYNDIKSAYETGLINGFEDNTFRPDENMTYAQAIKLAACMNQKYITGSVTLVNGSLQWYDSYVAYAREQKIISKNYDWNAPATRAGYVEIFSNALPEVAYKSKNNILDGDIPDVTMEHPQATDIYKLYRAGILTGMDKKGTFASKRYIKRSEVCAILTRMMNESARKELTLNPQPLDEILYELQTHEYYDEKPDTEKYYIPSVDELNSFYAIYSDALRDREIQDQRDVQKKPLTLEEYLLSGHSVFIQVREVGSGSIQMKLKSVSLENHCLNFVIDEKHPYTQTADMAFWYFVAILPDDQLDDLDLSDWKLPSDVFQSYAMETMNPESGTDGTVRGQEELKLMIDQEVVNVIWEDNDAVRALRELANLHPVTIKMSAYGGFEQVGALVKSLPRNDVQTTATAGDIVLYSGNQIVVFYGSNSWAYTRLGHISNKSEQEMAELLGNGSVMITISK